jgi:glycosyltransferase involved in cell wall biosynthesis
MPEQDRPTLVLVGGRPWDPDGRDRVGEALDGVPPGSLGRVVLTGYVPDATKAALLGGADALVYPSLYEGFGLPVLEAMACGAPVVASAHASLDEASGKAALRADPEDPAAFAAAIDQARAERERLAELGLEHARSFSWRAVGEIFLAGYEEARC